MKKIEKTVLIVFALVLVFTAGFGVGRASRRGDVVIRTEKSADSAAILTAPAQGVESETTTENQSDKSSEQTAFSPRVNINTADAEGLCQLPGIGEVIARRIIDYRKAHGDFEKVEQLKEVNGIGDKKLDAIRNMITVK